MADIIHRIGIKSPVASVYEALSTINGLAHWWTQDVEGDTTIAGNITFIFRSDVGEIKGQMVMEVMESNPGKNVRWSCVEGPEEWIGTDIGFDLSEQDGMTILIFRHRNWREVVDFMAHCSMKWAVFLLSLREYLETGKGKPSPGDLKIDNWN